MGYVECGCHSPLVARAWKQERRCRSAHEGMEATERVQGQELSNCVAA